MGHSGAAMGQRSDVVGIERAQSQNSSVEGGRKLVWFGAGSCLSPLTELRRTSPLEGRITVDKAG